MKRITALLIITLTLVPALAALDLSVQDAVDLAVKNNLQLVSAQLDVETAKRQADNSWNSLFPTVNGNAGFMRQNENTSGAMSSMVSGVLNTLGEAATNPLVTTPGSDLYKYGMALKGAAANYPKPADPEFMYSTGISIQEAFNPAMITNIKIAKEKYNNGLLTWQQTRDSIAVNIKKLYYAIVLQEQALEIRKATSDAQYERYIQAKTDYENGYVPELYVLQAQVTYNNSLPQINSARAGVESSKRQLAMLLNLPIDTALVLTDRIDTAYVEVDEQELLALAGGRYDVMALEGQLRLLNLQEKALKQSLFIPNLALSYSVQLTLSDLDNDFWTRDNWTDSGSFSATVAWNLSNLLPWSSSMQSLKDLQDGKKKLELSKTLLTENARIEIMGLVDKLEQSRDELENTQGTIELARKSFDMTQKAFENGSTGALELRDAENQLNQAMLAELSSRYNYLSALIDLEYAVNREIR